MIVSDMGQAKVFLIYILFGMLCVMLFDLFRVLTKRCGTTKLKVNILDGLYFLIAFCIILYAGVRFNLGALRYYQVFGLLIGMAVHKMLFSGIDRKLFELGFTVGGKLIRFIVKVLWAPVSWVLRLGFSLTEFIEEKILYVCHKLNRRAKKMKIKNQKKKKTVKKRLKMI